VHVHALEGGGALLADDAHQVHHRVHAGDGGGEPLARGDVAPRRRHAGGQVAAGAAQARHLPALGEQAPAHVDAHEAGGARDQDPHAHNVAAGRGAAPMRPPHALRRIAPAASVSTSGRRAANASGSPIWPYSPPRKPPWSPGKSTGRAPSRSASARAARAASASPEPSPTATSRRTGAARSASRSGW